jgi:hypothetical protein
VVEVHNAGGVVKLSHAAVIKDRLHDWREKLVLPALLRR